MHVNGTPFTTGRRNGQPSLALIGANGYNARHRVLPDFAPLAGRIEIVCYDLHVPAAADRRFRWVQVRDNADLARRLRQQQPTDVWIETPDQEHAKHIRLALAVGAERIVCEKCLAWDSTDAARLLPALQEAWPRQQVAIVDHYRLLDLVGRLRANAPRWLGEVQRVRVELLETQGVPPEQERSHASGMQNFFHHVLGVGLLWFDSDDLEPVDGAWARHPTAPVPDTYRAARFRSRRSGQVVLEGVVGKYLPRSRKRIHVRGTAGEAWLDRERATCG